MICIAYLHYSILAQCKFAYLKPEGPLGKLNIAVVVDATTAIGVIFGSCSKQFHLCEGDQLLSTSQNALYFETPFQLEKVLIKELLK